MPDDSLKEILEQFDQETEARIKESNKALDAEREDARRLRRALGMQYDDPLLLAQLSNVIKQHNGSIQIVVTLPGHEDPFNISNLTVLNAIKTQDALNVAQAHAKHYEDELKKIEGSK